MHTLITAKTTTESAWAMKETILMMPNLRPFPWGQIPVLKIQNTVRPIRGTFLSLHSLLIGPVRWFLIPHRSEAAGPPSPYSHMTQTVCLDRSTFSPQQIEPGIFTPIGPAVNILGFLSWMQQRDTIAHPYYYCSHTVILYGKSVFSPYLVF